MLKISKQLSSSWEELLKNFLQHQKARNLRPATISDYSMMIASFIRFAEDNQIEPRNLNPSNIDEYIVDCQDHKNSPVTINTKLRHLKVFLSYWMRNGEIPTFQVGLIKTDEIIKEPYTEEELLLLIKKPSSDNFTEWRTWALIQFLLGTGARISSVLEVKITDIDFEKEMILFRQMKNRRQLIIPLSEALAKSMKEWLNLWEHEPDDYLFPSSKGGKHKLYPNSIATNIREYNLRRGVAKSGVHRLRHTFAKNFIVNGGGSLQLQQILGHSTLEMTKKYVRLYATDLQQDFEKYCLLDVLKK